LRLTEKRERARPAKWGLAQVITRRTPGLVQGDIQDLRFMPSHRGFSNLFIPKDLIRRKRMGE
jgi:hypothetical protein